MVAFDTDMVGPFGYFADISRTLFCGPGRPSARQRELYRLAFEEIEYNSQLVKPGVSSSYLQHQARKVSYEFQQNAYVCVLHGVGMTDEFPRVNPIFSGPNPYEGVIQEGMILCIESYIGAPGEKDGVKFQKQVLVTSNGIEPISTYPWEADFLK